MDWNDIRLLIEIHRAGSFAGAAQAMGVHQATVSRRVTMLEQSSGARIFRRTPCGAELTDVGHGLLQRAQRVDDGVRQFAAALRDPAHSRQRAVTVRASEGVAGYMLTPLIAGRELGPLGVAARRLGAPPPPMTILPPHAQEKAEIAIVWTAAGQLPPGRDDDRIRKLATVRFVPFASAAYFRRGAAPPARWEDLDGHPLITLVDYGRFPDAAALGPWNRAAEAARPAAVPTYWTSAMAQLALDGAGICLLPTYAPMYAAGLLPLDLAVPPMRCDLWLQASDDDLKDPQVRDCFGLLARLFAGFEW